MNEFRHEGTSVLVANLCADSHDMETIPVLIGDEVSHFHDIDGGFDGHNGVHVVNLVHEVQGPGSPYRVNVAELSHDIEIHLDNTFYNLDVSAIRQIDEYPKSDYVLSMRVDDYMYGEQSFSNALTADIDKRETQW